MLCRFYQYAKGAGMTTACYLKHRKCLIKFYFWHTAGNLRGFASSGEVLVPAGFAIPRPAARREAAPAPGNPGERYEDRGEMVGGRDEPEG